MNDLLAHIHSEHIDAGRLIDTAAALAFEVGEPVDALDILQWAVDEVSDV